MADSGREPFLTDCHHQLADQVKEFASRQIEPQPAEEQEEEELTHLFLHPLATHHLLRYLIPEKYGGRLPGIDLRSLCLTRERPAYHSALADTVFASQGLGSYPLALAASKGLRNGGKV